MTRKTAAILGATIGIVLGASGGCLWHFSRPAVRPVKIQVVVI